jgi:hypothetical protein
LRLLSLLEPSALCCCWDRASEDIYHSMFTLRDTR